MGSDQILKKSLLGGFKKEGVLNYIEQLQAEIAKLKRELKNKTACQKDVDDLKAIKESMEKKLADFSAENEELKKENASLIEQNAAYSLKIEEATVSIADYEAKQKEMSEKTAAIEEKFSEIEKQCTEYNITETKVKEMVADAMNYSEKIIFNAKAAAAEIAGEADEAVKSAKAEIINANERIKTASVNFESSVASLKSIAESLLDALSSISSRMDAFGSEGE